MSASLALRMGKVTRALRVDAGISQEELAALCNLHRTYIGAIERGEKTITIETAQKLAAAFNISLSRLFALLEEQRD